MGENGIVRLLIAGMTVNVSSPTRLSAGSVVSFLVKQGSGGGLMLELKQSDSVDRSTEPATPPVLSSPGGARGHELLSALLHMGASLSATRSGLPAEAGTGSIGPPSLDRGGGQPPGADNEADVPTTQHSRPVVVFDAGQYPRLLPHSRPAQPDAGVHPYVSEAGPDAKPQIRGPSDQPTTPQPTLISFALPGQAERVQIVVEHRDENNEDEKDTHSDQAEKSIEARFSVDSGALGRVHVAMRQHGSAVSISLWAERPEVAAELLRERAELRDELGAAGVELDTLEFHSGAPSEGSLLTVAPAESSAT